MFTSTATSSDFYTKGVVIHAILSRIAIFGLVLLTVTVVQAYDSSTLVAIQAPVSNPLDAAIKHLFHGFSSWDGIYFTRIAQVGYEFENVFAFFPLYPAIIHVLQTICTCHYLPYVRLVTIPSIFLAVSVKLSFSSGQLVACLQCGLCSSCSPTLSVRFKFNFIYPSYGLFRLGRIVLGQEKRAIAYVAAVLFCYNPASIFFSAAYTESLFALLTFSGLTELYQDRDLKATLYFAGASLTRSNGIFLIGFLLYKHFNLLRPPRCDLSWITRLIPHICKVFIMISCVLAPFIGFQFYAYYSYCTPPSPRPWCTNLPPLIYTFVQSHYWYVVGVRVFSLG